MRNTVLNIPVRPAVQINIHIGHRKRRAYTRKLNCRRYLFIVSSFNAYSALMHQQCTDDGKQRPFYLPVSCNTPFKFIPCINVLSFFRFYFVLKIFLLLCLNAYLCKKGVLIPNGINIFYSSVCFNYLFFHLFVDRGSGVVFLTSLNIYQKFMQ